MVTYHGQTPFSSRTPETNAGPRLPGPRRKCRSQLLTSTQAANASWLLIASKAFFASSWVALTLPYQVVPPTFDWLAAYVSIWLTVRLVAPPKALLTFWYVPLQVPVPPDPSMILQILVKSIDTPPIGAGALILLPPSAELLK